ncbi:hypothetical protein ACH5RR_002284 [Cinchona calisaya]|uniref:TF-B3 domain-containing protein n=1 Tax=Cinchona calisaya TaxID=153742 RepID=A0ABD3B6H2_9GENT
MVLDQKAFFFKTCNELTEKRLRIPPKFVKDSLKEVPKRIILDGPSGGPWSAKVVKTAGDVFLGDGWQKFVKDNMLQEHNFLLFGCDGSAMRFNVQIYEESGLEREYKSSPAITHQNLDSHTRAAHPRGRGQNRNDIAVIHDKIKTFYAKSPYFERLIKGYNVRHPFIMFIPKTFADKHFQRAKTKIRLTNSEGEAWEVNYTINTAGRFVFSGGWSSFVRDNKLKIGNVCIFELVAEKVLKVHIFR